jgi:large subunit ribosomal protein L4
MADAPSWLDDKVTLDDAVFGAPFNGPLVHEASWPSWPRAGAARTRRSRAARSAAAAPSRGARRARPRPRRLARARRCGRRRHGLRPSPRHYTVKVNRKARRAALRAALSVHASRGSLFVPRRGAASTRRRPSRRTASGRALGGSVLVVLAAEEAAAAKSFRNLAGVSVLAAETPASADIVGAATLVVSREALDTPTWPAVTARGSAPPRGAPTNRRPERSR